MLNDGNDQYGGGAPSGRCGNSETWRSIRLPIGCCYLNRIASPAPDDPDGPLGLDVRGERFATWQDLSVLRKMSGSMIRFSYCSFAMGELPLVPDGEDGSREWLREITLLLVAMFARAADGRHLEIWLENCALSAPPSGIPSPWPPRGPLKVYSSSPEFISTNSIARSAHAFHWELHDECPQTVRLGGERPNMRRVLRRPMRP